MDFTGARDSERSGICWAVCKSATRSRQITTPALHYSSFFTGLLAAQPTVSKTEGKSPVR